MRNPKPVPVHNLKVSRRGTIKKRSFLWRWRRVWYLGVLALAVAVSGLVLVISQVELPVDPRIAPTQDQTTFVCSAEVKVNCGASNAMAQLHGSQDREIVTYEQIPPILRDAVLSVEDKDFFKHDGVDPAGIARAAVSDLKGSGAQQGGSTITQQYVKQTYLSSERTVNRKIKEAVMAIKLEQQLSKEDILTRYLNTVYFGRGAYGVQAASRAWFGHDIAGIQPGEAAFLAGLLRSPNGADPWRGPASLKEAQRRRRVGLTQMLDQGYITPAVRSQQLAVEMDPAKAGDEPFIQRPPKTSSLCVDVKGSEYGSNYFCEYVRSWLVSHFGQDAVLGGGLKVYTTLDLNMQKAAFDAVTTTLDRAGDPSGSLVALDDEGHIKAMMGGTDFAKSQVNLATGREGGGLGRQPGSTFKAFALAEAVREGYSIGSVVPAPTKIGITDPRCLNGEKVWNVKGGSGGSASLVNATKRSLNTAYAQLMVKLGPEKVLAMARNLGVSAKGLEPYCSLVLGSGSVSVLDMASAYSTFANRGIAKTPIAVTRVEKPDGTAVDFTAPTHQALTPTEAGRVTYALQQVVQGGTGAAANFGRPAAGKTGTTQDNADAWFVGFTPKLTAAVWMGYPDSQRSMGSVHGIKVQGGTFPAQMWRKFMEAATANMDTGDFPKIDDLGGGEVLDVRYGKTSVSSSLGGSSVSGGGSTGGVTTTVPTGTGTTVPVTSPTTTPVTTPVTTPTTTPVTSPTTTPAGGGPGKPPGKP